MRISHNVDLINQPENEIMATLYIRIPKSALASSAPCLLDVTGTLYADPPTNVSIIKGNYPLWVAEVGRATKAGFRCGSAWGIDWHIERL